MVVILLLGALSLLGCGYAAMLLSTAIRRGALRPPGEAVALGAVVNFFDTLGIGSFAPTTAWLKLRKLVPDAFLPATLNSGHALPTVVQALIFIGLIRVDVGLMVACIAAAVVGSVLGVRIVGVVSQRAVQVVVGLAMLVAAMLYAMANLGLLPPGGNAVSLTTPLFWGAVAGHFALGALMAFGIGLYAPSLVMLSLMGLNPAAAFPIMMGSCAFLMPVSGWRFMRTDRIDLRIVLGLALGGIPAVLLAAYVVKTVPLVALRWGVVVVVLYTAAVLLRTATRSGSPLHAEALGRVG